MRGSSSRRLPSIQLARISCVHWNWFRPSSLQGGVAMMIKNNSHSRQAGWATVLSNWYYMSLASSNLEEKLPNNPTVQSLSTFYKHTIKLQSLRKSTSAISQLQYYYHLLSSLAPSSAAAINQKPPHNIRIIWISSDWFHRRGGCCCYGFSRWGGTSHLWELLMFWCTFLLGVHTHPTNVVKARPKSFGKLLYYIPPSNYTLSHHTIFASSHNQWTNDIFYVNGYVVGNSISSNSLPVYTWESTWLRQQWVANSTTIVVDDSVNVNKLSKLLLLLLPPLPLPTLKHHLWMDHPRASRRRAYAPTSRQATIASATAAINLVRIIHSIQIKHLRPLDVHLIPNKTWLMSVNLIQRSLRSWCNVPIRNSTSPVLQLSWHLAQSVSAWRGKGTWYRVQSYHVLKVARPMSWSSNTI